MSSMVPPQALGLLIIEIGEQLAITRDTDCHWFAATPAVIPTVGFEGSGYTPAKRKVDLKVKWGNIVIYNN